MPSYEFRCTTCADTFVEVRPMSASGDPATCPKGHSDTIRLLSVSAVGGRGDAPVGGGGGGGCCGGGCGCG